MKPGPARRITHDKSFCLKKNPCWSPDGAEIVMSRQTGGFGGQFGIWAVRADGSGIRQVTESTPKKEPRVEPDWSSQNKLVYISYTYTGTDGFLHMHTCDPDGKNDKRIIAADSAKVQFNMHPCWSPDGKTIAFVGTREGGNPEILLCDADGGSIRRITNDPGMDEWPSWSPDGKRIAFHSNREGTWGIFVMDSDGKNVRRLSEPNSQDTTPRWSPTGKHIAFVTRRDGNDEIYVMDADGRNPVNVSRDSGVDRFPAWRPDGKALAWISMRENMPELYVAEIVES